MPPVQTLTTAQGRLLAYHQTTGIGSGVIFLGGYRSDMGGTKAVALEAWAKARGRAFLRFDYGGHGGSGGDFTELGIADWFDDARAALNLTQRPSGYADGPYIFTQRLIDQGRANLVLRAPLALPFPTRFLQGTADTDVPVAVAQRLFDHASGPDIRLTLVKGADHRFSTPDCLALIESNLDEILA